MKTYERLAKAWAKETGIKKDDKVRVVSVAESHVMGWLNSWVPGMKAGVELTVKTDNISDPRGVYLTDSKRYPFFVLEKVDKTIEVEIVSSDTCFIHPDTIVKITPLESIDFGGKGTSTIDRETSNKLAEAFKLIGEVGESLSGMVTVGIGDLLMLSNECLDISNTYLKK